MTTEANTKTTGRGRPAIEGTRIEIKLEDELLGELEAYATEHGLRRPDALRELLRAGLAAVAAPARKSIWEVFADAENDEDLYNLVYGDGMGRGEHVAHDYDGKVFDIAFDQIRGHWIFTRADETAEKDERGLAKWNHTYIVCKDRDEALAMFQDIVLESCKAWRPEEGKVMWEDCGYGDDLMERLGKAGLIPIGTYDQDVADAAYDAATD